MTEASLNVRRCSSTLAAVEPVEAHKAGVEYEKLQIGDTGSLLEVSDGPMLRHGLQEHHGRRLMWLPVRRADHPDADRLAERYRLFQAI